MGGVESAAPMRSTTSFGKSGLAAATPLPAGRAFDRIDLKGSAPLLSHDIRWVHGTP